MVQFVNPTTTVILIVSPSRSIVSPNITPPDFGGPGQPQTPWPPGPPRGGLRLYGPHPRVIELRSLLKRSPRSHNHPLSTCEQSFLPFSYCTPLINLVKHFHRQCGRWLLYIIYSFLPHKCYPSSECRNSKSINSLTGVCANRLFARNAYSGLWTIAPTVLYVDINCPISHSIKFMEQISLWPRFVSAPVSVDLSIGDGVYATPLVRERIG
jgi:hypothetical protein